MSIYIKNIKMPTTYPLTITVYPNGQVLSETVGAKDKHGFAIHVSPHGRLIDADVLADVFRSFIAMYDSCPFSIPDMARRNELQSMLTEVINAPTVIPMSKEDEI